jgi:SAM-dependent methyltransferase
VKHAGDGRADVPAAQQPDPHGVTHVQGIVRVCGAGSPQACRHGEERSTWKADAVSDELFYGPDQAFIHHNRFGKLAAVAAGDLLALLDEAGLRDGTVIDLGCGSGILARLVSDAGYDVVGVDISPAMIDLARQQAPRASFHVGSLLDAEIPPAVAVTAIGEALNYATDPRAGLAELEWLARRISQALDPGGAFLFDIATPGREEGARQQFHDNEGWTLYMKAEEKGDRSDRFITIFRRGEDGRYVRSDEHHVLRLYEPEAAAEALRRAGLDAEVMDDYASVPPHLPQIHGWKVIRGRKPTV